MLLAAGADRGNVRVLTADTDLAQLVASVADDTTKMIDGPFVLTSVGVTGPLAMYTGGACGVGVATSLGVNGGAAMRVFIPAGMTVCANSAGTAFSGFRPY